ncbi:MAG: iron chelate uptake ABC transporter family permease subunit [Candidatus Chromulinivorax sp.]|nr:iron chelate uptake ABC transporter family permease subunit [Candidatus Chromulinivorax sp.]
MLSTFYKILIGTTLVGITTGIVGCFTLLNKQSLLGDTIAHATLPGLTGMFLLVLQKSYALLLCGAAATGLLGALCVHYITHTTKLKKDAALGIVLSTFFGIGIIFLTIIQKLPTAHQAGIDKFLFGQAATLLHSDIIILMIISCIVIVTIIALWKELKIISFDPMYAQTIGLPVKKIHGLVTCLIVLTVIVGLQTVGLILMSSFLIAPTAAARQWTNKLHITVLLSVGFSLIATTVGTIISSSYPHIPTGPTIVIIATTITLISIIIAPSCLVTTKAGRL